MWVAPGGNLHFISQLTVLPHVSEPDIVQWLPFRVVQQANRRFQIALGLMKQCCSDTRDKFILSSQEHGCGVRTRLLI